MLYNITYKFILEYVIFGIMAYYLQTYFYIELCYKAKLSIYNYKLVLLYNHHKRKTD